MIRTLAALGLAAAILAPVAVTANPLSDWFRAPQRSTYTSSTGAGCDIIVKRPGGNPSQDMTGSIGHAKSHQSNGGRNNPTFCNAPGAY